MGQRAQRGPWRHRRWLTTLPPRHDAPVVRQVAQDRPPHDVGHLVPGEAAGHLPDDEPGRRPAGAGRLHQQPRGRGRPQARRDHQDGEIGVGEHGLDSRPVVVDLPRQGTGGGPAIEAVLADADLAVLVVPARLRAATAARLLVEAPGSGWAEARLVVRQVAGGLSRDEVADVVGRPVLGGLPHDRSVVPRGERGEPPAVSPRSPLGSLARLALDALAPRTTG